MQTLKVKRIDAALPLLGQGTWNMGNASASRAAEAAALRAGLGLGMTLIDTAEMYASGGAEEVVAQAIAGRRNDVFLVSKVLPENASRRGTIKACEASLKRMQVETLDLYLLHWPGNHPLAETLAAFEELREAGKIRHWGVSNFDLAAMREVESLVPGRCACNQVLYNLQRRGIEHDLLPWCVENGILVQAYSPLDQGRLRKAPPLAAVARRHALTAEQAALAWSVRFAGVQAIPKSANLERVKQNAQAAGVVLTQADLREIDTAYPPPTGPTPLETA
ncbi:MAG: aldo/keto reductase [Planctomycetes bacterium]|nr:aldo/keto reductase [Planctomycetota bacterium]